MIKELLAVANKMDVVGLTKEADYIDFVIKKLSGNVSPSDLYTSEDPYESYEEKDDSFYDDEGEAESAFDYFNSNQIVKENMTNEEMSFLEALNNFTSSFERLQASSEPGDFDEMSDVIGNIETMAMDTISQKSFERSRFFGKSRIS
jgi:hypothetical protein